MDENLVVFEDFLTWQQMSADLRALKAKESKLRDKLTAAVLSGSLKPVSYIVDGYIIKATPKTTIKLDEAVLNSIRDILTEEELTAIVYSPSITKSKLKKLPEDSTLMEAIIEKPGKSTLKVELCDENS